MSSVVATITSHRYIRQLIGQPVCLLVVGLMICSAVDCAAANQAVLYASAADADDVAESLDLFPWYSEAEGGIRQVDEAQASEGRSTHRDSDWLRKPKSNSRQFNGLSGWTSFFTVLFWVVIVVIILAIVGFLVWAFMRQETTMASDDIQDWLVDQRTDEQRIEALPFALTKPLSDLLQAAEQARNDGNYRLAIIYLFSHVLIQLDRAHLIRLAKGKTNRQYLAELSQLKEVRRLTLNFMLLFERVFFGRHAPSQKEADECWQWLVQFDQRLAEVAK